MAQALPDIEHVACDIHTADGLDDVAVLDEETFDAIGEVPRDGIAVAAVEVGDVDCPVGVGNHIVEAFSPGFHYKMVNALRGGLHAKLPTHGGVYEIGLQPAFGEEFTPLCGNAVVIEMHGSASAWLQRVIDDVHEWRNNQLSELSPEERSALLQGLPVHGVQQRLQEVAGAG